MTWELVALIAIACQLALINQKLAMLVKHFTKINLEA